MNAPALALAPAALAPAVAAWPHVGAAIIVRNVFRPERGREVAAVERPITVRAWLAGRGIAEFDKPTICLLSGRALMRAEWSTAIIGPGDICTFMALPGRGGGGGGGSNPLQAVLTIAMMVVAPEIAGFLAPELAWGAAVESAIGMTGFNTLAFAGLKGAISMAGSALLGSVLGGPRSASPSDNWSGVGSSNVPAASPTYSLQSQGNRARLGQPVPVLFGRHLIYPDLAAEPYVEYVDNEQYLYQLHVVTVGECDIEAVRIEDSPIASFAEVSTNIVPPGGALTLVDPSVVSATEVSGQELKAPNQLGEGESEWIGPFVAGPVDTNATHIGIDIIFPRGLYYANDSGGLNSKTADWTIEAQPIDDEGAPDGDWQTLATESHTASSNTGIRLSFKYAVTSGRYQVRAKRTDTKDTSSRAGHEVRWGGMRAYITETTDFSKVTVLELKMRATDNLSQRSARQVNCIATRKLPIWNSETGWSAPTATRSIAWALADVCRNQVYGARKDDQQIDPEGLAALDAVWESRGDHFDGVFDTATNWWDALTRIARVGRAVPVKQWGVVRVVRDAAQTIPVAMFGPRNIVKGSFKIQYVLPTDDSADAVNLEYFSSRTWKPAEVARRVADDDYLTWLTDNELTDTTDARDQYAALDDDPARTKMFGVTDRAHALREAEFMAADNRYRRILPSFTAEMDGLIPTYGDLIAVTHDIPRWGIGGEIVDYDVVNDILVLSESVTFAEGETHYIALRARSGGLLGPFEVEAVADEPFRVHLIDPLPDGYEPYTGGSEERTYFSFGAGVNYVRLARVLGMRPRAIDRFEIAAVIETDLVHVN